MNINQLARNQQMMYNFINRGTSGDYRAQLKTQFSNVESLALQKQDDEDDAVAGMLKSMGISGLQGRTVREMAQYQVRVQSGASGAKQTNRADAQNAASAVKKANAKDAAQDAKQTQASSAASNGFTVRERYTPISDKATRSMQRMALEDAKKSVKKTVDYTTGKAHGAKTDGEKPANLLAERNKEIQEHLKEVDPSKRTAAFNTMNKVYENEADRIAGYIKERTPDWNDWGDEFDEKILDDYKPGINYFF